jgi:hypothetical protein
VADLLAGAQRDRYLLVYWDEAHIHQSLPRRRPGMLISAMAGRGAARRALLGRLVLAGPVGQALLLWALSL